MYYSYHDARVLYCMYLYNVLSACVAMLLLHVALYFFEFQCYFTPQFVSNFKFLYYFK